MLFLNEREYRYVALWIFADIEQSFRRCPHPGIPVGGRLLNHKNFAEGTWVEFSCNDNLVMIGKRRQLCLQFLEWSHGGAPLCIGKHKTRLDLFF